MNPSLPKIYVIGDSISLDYGPHLEKALAGVWAYSRKSGEDEARLDLDKPCGANGGDSGMVREFLEGLRAGQSLQVNTLLINCGLHDIKTDPVTAARSVEPDAYAKNLDAIVDLALAVAENLVWVSTTPVDDVMHARRTCGFHRLDADVLLYNQIARERMEAGKIPVLDLGRYTRTLGNGPEVFRDGVHFRPPVMEKQAAFIAGWLEGCG